MVSPPSSSTLVPRSDTLNFQRPLFEGLVVIAVYFGAARLGLSLAFLNASVSPIWPPTGVAIAAVLLLGFRIWPAILIAAFLANLFTPVSPVVAAAIAAGNTLEALLAGFVLQKSNFHKALDRARDVFALVIAAMVCSTASATIGTISLLVGGATTNAEVFSLWITWWLGDSVGALLVAPLFLVWSTRTSWWSRQRLLEAILILVLLAGSALATFSGPFPIPIRLYPIVRLTVPFFLWAAFRLGQRGVTLGSVILSIFAVWGTTKGTGPFFGRSANEALLLLQVFLGSNVVMFLFLAATVEERRIAAETLQENQHLLAANLAVTRILAESPALNTATSRILETIGTKLDWQVGDMWTPDADGKTLHCLSFWNSDSVKVESFKQASFERPFAPGVGLPGRVWNDPKPTWVRDVTQEENFPRAPYAVSAGLHSAFAFPILYGDRVLGVMEFFSADIREPDDALLTMFASIGNQIGQFVERKRAEEERELLLKREHSARSEAELANRTKDEFLAIVSHELRTPLNAIVGWSGMLQRGALDTEKERKAFEIIERNAKAQAQLIDDILDVSRIVTGRLRLDLRPVQLNTIISTAIDSIRPLTDAKRIHLTMDLESKPSLVSGDPDRLQQVVWNLLSNAVKFTPPEGQIGIRLRNTNSHIEIVVTDTGQGIEAEVLPHVFDRFRQADSSKTRRHGGLGLGLAIVQHLVELHDGTITARSEGEGKGSEFRIVLPSLETRERSIPHRLEFELNVREQRSQLVGRRILAVEDDEDARQMIEIVLRSQGADVVAVGSVREAIAVLDDKKWKPTLILSDLGMPDEDGYDLIRKVRSRNADDSGEAPAIALTGYAGKDEVERALQAGYQAHLLKPIDLSELVKTIAAMSPKA